jgi:hypothetical protein
MRTSQKTLEPFTTIGMTIGLYTGAGGPKSEIQASLFGGAAGRSYDPCYHRARDHCHARAAAGDAAARSDVPGMLVF